MSDRLRPDGKPMRALRALADVNEPITEQTVWLRARRDMLDATTFHAALLDLLVLGYAKRSGRPGGYRYVITDLGRGRLEAS